MVASAQLTGVASAVVSDAGSATSNTVGYIKTCLLEECTDHGGAGAEEEVGAVAAQRQRASRLPGVAVLEQSHALGAIRNHCMDKKSKNPK